MMMRACLVVGAMLMTACGNTGGGGEGGAPGPSINNAAATGVGSGGGIPGSACLAVVTKGPGDVPFDEPGITADDGSCCAGCFDGLGVCRSVACPDSADCGEPTACGHNGQSCMNCDDGNPCTADACVESGCAHYPYDRTKTCTVGGKAGRCFIDKMDHGKCCTSMTDPTCCAGCLMYDSTTQQDICVSACPSGQSCHASTGRCQSN